MSETTAPEQLVRQRVRVLSRSLEGAGRGDVEHLHQARVATRRLREALPVVAAGSRARKLQRTVRKLTRALGPVRELDVALITLDQLDAEGAAPRPAIARLRRALGAERRQMQADLRKRVDRVNVEKLEKRAAAAARTRRAKGRRKDASGPKQSAGAERREAQRAEALRAAMDEAAGIYLPDRLHQVRIAGKKLRYATELVREMSTSPQAKRTRTAWLRTLKQAQDILGRINDLEVLIGRVREVQGSAGAPNLRLSAEMDRLVRRLETEARQQHGHYMAMRRKLVAICDAA